MTEVIAPVASRPAKKKKKKSFFRNWKTGLFVFLMLLYPVAQFAIMWFGVNINSIFLAFKTYERGHLVWVFESKLWDGTDFWGTLFYNFVTLFESFQTKSVQDMFASSAVYLVLSCFVNLPISMVFSYFIFKKIKGATFFKIIFFIPSILPLFILALVYSLSFDPNGGIFPGFMKLLGIDTGDFFANLFLGENVGDSASWMVWLFFIWSGVGYNCILLTAAMSRIPRDILESCKMDGVSPIKEFFRMIIPLSWPTITTLFIFGMMAVFSTTFQPFFLTSGMSGTMTIGLRIYQDSGGSSLQTPATLGLFCTLIAAPIIITVRHFLNKCYENVGF